MGEKGQAWERKVDSVAVVAVFQSFFISFFVSLQRCTYTVRDCPTFHRYFFVSFSSRLLYPSIIDLYNTEKKYTAFAGFFFRHAYDSVSNQSRRYTIIILTFIVYF